jgi:ATP-dependent Clp protease protease subunit
VDKLADEKESRLIVLSSNINKDSAKDIIEKILKINKDDDEKDNKEKDYKRKPIELVVNSFGGSVYDGFGIVTVIENSKTPVHTYVYGYAMSMGLLIGAAGHKRFGGKMATFMYHQISTGVWGKIEELKQEQEECLRLEVIYDGSLLSKTAIRKSELDEVKKMKKEWYISADEALKLKLIDEII